jgi:DNA-binding CsgD family transcriptional regulator
VVRARFAAGAELTIGGMLLGRDRERHTIDAVLNEARRGTSATIALVGEPGIGKTALLDDAARRATGMRLLRARGMQSEAQIPFASLLELIRPALGALAQIPGPQAAALERALALRPGAAEERFAIGAATLSLLAAYAEPRPLLILVDDAQWLDASSAQALLFAVRRLIADPIAVLIAAREGEPSLLDDAGLPTLNIRGLDLKDTATLLDEVGPDDARRLHAATAGNPLALLELGRDVGELALVPIGAPLLLSSRISRAFTRQVESLDPAAQEALVLAAATDTGDLALLEVAATRLGIDTGALVAAADAGLVTLSAGRLHFRHPLLRSAIYTGASTEARCAVHRALAAALPDRDVDRRAWHLASAAVGTDPAAAAALEQAGRRARDRGAYASAHAAFERAARLVVDVERRPQLLFLAAEAGWNAGLAGPAVVLLDEARESTDDAALLVRIDQLRGHIAARRGPVMEGHAILAAAAERATPERAVAMLAEAVSACFYAGDPTAMLAAAERAGSRLPSDPSPRAGFLAACALGMARIVGGDAAAGAAELHRAVLLAERSAELREDVQLLPWLAILPIFLRQAGAGRALIEESVAAARSRGALSALPAVLNLIARDQATTDRWAMAEASYREAIELARETGQRTGLVFGLAGLAWLEARRGREPECRAHAGEALQLSRELGTRIHEVWATAALGELELGLGRAGDAVEHFRRQQSILAELGVTDVDLDPAPDLVEAHVRLRQMTEARRLAAGFHGRALAKGQPWALARALRSRALVANDSESAAWFDDALAHHAQTLDTFEGGRTRLAYGERLRRTRNRVLAREQLRAALEIFEAGPWADRARAELKASGETLRRRDPSTLDELTPQELQIAHFLAGGSTTREAAAALFLSPKTIEYHLHHVYLKLDIHSREELTRTIGRAS